MIPLSLVLVGGLVLAAGWLLMRRLGPGGRIGRILAVTPVVPVAEARELAGAGPGRYVGVLGRIDAEEPFEDDAHRPLVLRRTRLELQRGSRWEAFEDDRQVVPFEISEGLDRIAVDGAALDTASSSSQRESRGPRPTSPTASPRTSPATRPPACASSSCRRRPRPRVLGVPCSTPPAGRCCGPAWGGRCRVHDLERDEAMRLLAEGHRGRRAPSRS